MNTVKKEPPFFLMLLLVSFGSISAVLYTPALPEITRFLGATLEQGQMTMTVFLVGYALGNLPYGPLSNRFGRKPALYGGILLAMLGSILILISSRTANLALFLLGRFLTALGSSAGLKISFTIIGDLYQHEKAARKIANFILAFAIGPGIAVAIGGYMTEHFGWTSVFYFLLAYSALLFFLSLLIPETCPEKDPKALNIKKIFSGYTAQLRHEKFLLATLLMAGGTSIIYLFASQAPFIGIDTIGLSPEQYGLLNFIPPIGMIAGSFLTHFLVGKKDALFTIQLGILIALLISAIMVVLFISGIVTPLSLFIPMPFLYVGDSLIFTNSSAFAMSHTKDKSNASAIMNFMNLGVTVLILLIAGTLPLHPYILPLSYLVICLLMLFIRRRLSRIS